jgi:predicted O-methyltransferase YrrM
MKPLPDVTLSFEPLTRMLHSAIPLHLLMTGIELKVFAHLTGPTSAESLAQRIGTHEQNTRFLLDGLTANGLLSKQNGRYANTPLAATFLVEGGSTYLGDVFMDLVEWMRPALDSMTALIKDGPPQQRRSLATSQRAWEAEIFANSQRAGRAQSAAAMAGKLPEFPRMSKMLDLGGGAGLIGLAIVAAHPMMTGVIFDKPEVVEVAQRFIRQCDMEDRVSVVGGDFTEDPIGDGYDLVWTSFALRRRDLDMMLRRIHAALNPGGICMVLSEGVTDEHTKPTGTLNAMMAFILCSNEELYADGEIAQAMRHAGFRSVETRVVDSAPLHGPAVVNIGRK